MKLILRIAAIASAIATVPIAFAAANTVYAMSNDATDNRVYAWKLGFLGSFIAHGNWSTGGIGTGTTETPGAGPVDGIDPLGSQGALTLSHNKRFLFAVNAGDGTVSVFRVLGTGQLELVDRESTGGDFPVSVSAGKKYVYVVNVNDPANSDPSEIVVFSLSNSGNLQRLKGETMLSAPNARPSQVSVSPNGEAVVVTERETDRITVFPTEPNGGLGTPTWTASPRPVPFGFAFFNETGFVVSEAAPMDPLGSSASSYTLGGTTASVVSAGVINGQMASCWTTVSKEGDRAWISNTASDTVSTYGIDEAGMLTLRQAGVGTGVPMGAPTDAALSRNGRQLFQLLGGTGQIAVFFVNSSGDLMLLGVRNTGLPSLGSQGIAAL